MKRIISFGCLIFFVLACRTAENPKNEHESEIPVKNIILMIGDGMSFTQVYAAYTANKGKLNMEKAKAVGFLKTYSNSHYITDSGAGGTAISTGIKTNNTKIGVDPDNVPQTTILELAEANGLATGLISTSAITHATPATFIAHQESRYTECAIASDFIGSGIDIFIGGGRTFFEDSTVNVSEQLRKEDYSIVYSLKDIDQNDPNPVGCLAADEGMPKMSEGRGDFLSDALKIALSRLSKNEKGFFLMLEGSQIDWAGHDNDLDYLIGEMLDFDQAIGEAFKFADKNPGTLVIVTADHETGGLTLLEGDIDAGELNVNFSRTDHTATMVPVFSYGTGAMNFTGMYENTDLFVKMKEALGFE